MRKETIFTEIGLDFDNHKWGLGVSTEMETAYSEIRKNGFSKMKIREIYLRIWLFKRVFILSSKEGIKSNFKNRNNLKIVIGISDK